MGDNLTDTLKGDEFNAALEKAWDNHTLSNSDIGTIKMLANLEKDEEDDEELSKIAVQPRTSSRRVQLEMKRQEFRLSYIFESFDLAAKKQEEAKKKTSRLSGGTTLKIEQEEKKEQEEKSKEEAKLKKDKRNIKRKLIVQELLDTEESYLKALQTMIMVYYKPLSARVSSSQPLITANDVETIFYSIESLYENHLVIKDKLVERVESWDEKSCLADIFTSMDNIFLLYLDFVKNYTKSLETIRCCRKQRPLFEDFISDMQSGLRANSQRYNLTDLLIMPIQRIPRYALLLDTLIKNTDENHPDIQDLRAALSVVNEIALRVNEGQRYAESVEEVHSLSLRLRGEYEPFDGPGRRHIMSERVVELYDKKVRKWENLILLNDTIICAKDIRKTGELRHLWSSHLDSVTCSKGTDDVLLEQKSIIQLQHMINEKQFSHISPVRRKTAKGAKELKQHKDELSKLSASFPLLIHLSIGKKLTTKTLLFQTEQDRDVWLHRLSEQVSETQSSKSLQPDDGPGSRHSPSPSVTSISSISSRTSSITDIKKKVKKKSSTGVTDPQAQSEGFTGTLGITIQKAQLAAAWESTSIATCSIDDEDETELHRTKASGSKTPVWQESTEVSLSGCQTIKFICYSSTTEDNPIIVGFSLVPIAQVADGSEHLLHIRLQNAGRLIVSIKRK